MVEVLERNLSRLSSFVYHSGFTDDVVNQMESVRQSYINLASYLIDSLPECRSKSISLTHLEESCMRAIQALALQGEPVCEKVEM